MLFKYWEERIRPRRGFSPGQSAGRQRRNHGRESVRNAVYAVRNTHAVPPYYRIIILCDEFVISECVIALGRAIAYCGGSHNNAA